jgi:hypothetical protein
MDEIDVWRAANQMLKLYGEDAVMKAGLRSDALLNLGDIDGCNVWKRVVAAIKDLSRAHTAEPLN